MQHFKLIYFNDGENLTIFNNHNALLCIDNSQSFPLFLSLIFYLLSRTLKSTAKYNKHKHALRLTFLYMIEIRFSVSLNAISI